MRYTKANIIFFSATGTTEKVATAIAQGTGINTIETCDLIKKPQVEKQIPADELTIIAMPVYAGRIPAPAAQALQNFNGNHSPAIIVCVYGNREFDDALVEMQDIAEKQGFEIVSAAAFIARHSIFPTVATQRPDADDIAIAHNFGKESLARLHDTDILHLPPIAPQGNRPYRTPGNVPLKPRASRRCNMCGACALQCPTQAIDSENPRHTDSARCISCAHCIAICPRGARRFGGLIYRIASQKFTKAYASPRKEPYIIYR
ncbi:MAG: 4Fe-4S binding protein [Coprobacter sp.]|nr:4Fe-4S binding protein [Coprobacter sp.]